MYLILLIIILGIVRNSETSAGDRSPYYQRCIERCSLLNCTDDGVYFKNTNNQPIYLAILQWSCDDECGYDCMWKTVDAFHQRNWRTPQFYGKWPFIRILGLQEPASAIFSMLNFYAHWRMLKKFRAVVNADSPLYFLWHFFALVSLNAWVWSTIFHSRDWPMTEFMDYICAFSMVLTSCFCMLVRLLRNSPKFILITLTVFYVAFFANHVAYLSLGKFDYGYNMEVNIFIGTFTAICWFGWCSYNRIRQPYVWKCTLFVTLAGFVMLLEIIDTPPIFYIFDCHSLWHLSTAPLILLFYSYMCTAWISHGFVRFLIPTDNGLI